MIVVDTTVWIDYFNGLKTSRTDYLDDLLSHQPIIMGDLILCEVLQGFRSDSDFESARQVLIRFPQVSMLSTELAVKSALNYRDLRMLGISIRKTIDCLIATYCIESGNELLHDDRDFDPFETRLGLKVVNP